MRLTDQKVSNKVNRNHKITYEGTPGTYLQPSQADFAYVQDTYGSALIRHGTEVRSSQDIDRDIFYGDDDGMPIAHDLGYAVLCDGARVRKYASIAARAFNIQPHHRIEMMYKPPMYEPGESLGMSAHPENYFDAEMSFKIVAKRDIEYTLCRQDGEFLGEAFGTWFAHPGRTLDDRAGTFMEVSYQEDVNRIVCRALGALAGGIGSIVEDIRAADTITQLQYMPELYYGNHEWF